MEQTEVVRTDEQNPLLVPFEDWERELDYKIFPERIRRIIEHLCKVLQCPKEFVIASMFQAVGIVYGNGVQLVQGAYKNPPLLWIAIVAPSGTGKSKPLKLMLEPIFDIDRKDFDDYEREAKQYRHQVETRRKSKIPIDTPDAPKLRQMIIQDSTEEGRMKVMQENPGGILLYNDELDGFFGRMGRYTKNGGTDEITRLIDCWDNGDIKIIRKNQEYTRPIKRAFLSIVGTIQPETLRRRFENPAYTETGFAQRWLFVWNDEYKFPEYSKDPLDPAIMQDWRNFIQEIQKGAKYDKERETPNKIVMTESAEQIYREFYQEIRAKKIEATTDAARSLYAKLEINIYRWALIAQMIVSPQSITITKKTMRFAANSMHYFEHTGMKLLDMIQGAGEKAKNQEAAEKRPRIGDVCNIVKGKNPEISNEALGKLLGVSRQAVSQAIKRAAPKKPEQ